MKDYRDACIEDLADMNAALEEENAALVEQVCALTADREVYRLIAVQVFHYLHDRQTRIDRLDSRVIQLREENRALRGRPKEPQRAA